MLSNKQKRRLTLLVSSYYKGKVNTSRADRELITLLLQQYEITKKLKLLKTD